jgi:very-short-patch-repair endonuclease
MESVRGRESNKLLAHARALRRESTDAERMLWRHLRARQLAGFKFRRQEVIGPYIVDFVCFDARLIIEIDGGQHAQ